MTFRVSLLLIVLSTQYLCAQRDVTLTIDSTSIKPGYTAFRFDLVVTNNRDTEISMFTPEYYLVDARWKRPSTTALGIVNSPYTVHIKSAGNCVDTSFVATVKIPYTLVPASAIVTIAPKETKKIGQIYINDHESCYKRDRAHGLLVSVTYNPTVTPDVLNTIEERKLKDAQDRLWQVAQKMQALNFSEEWNLRQLLTTEFRQYLDYEKMIGKITNLSLSTKTVAISQ